jgi:DNA-binding CsgD family transcriptional regulator
VQSTLSGTAPKQFVAENQNYEYNRFKLAETRALMPDQTKATSEWARKRAAGKILREALIKRREAYFDLLVSGYSIEQIASRMKKSPSAVRRAVGQALAKRRLDAPEDYAHLQVARLTKALRCVDVSLESGDLKAIAPFVKVVRELNLYHGVHVGPARPSPVALPEIAPTSAPLALTHSPGMAVDGLFENEKSCVKEVLSR